MKAFALDDLSLPERRDALRQQARAWAPFDDAEYRVAVRGRAGLVIAWSREQVAAVQADRPQFRAMEMWPETLLRPAMLGDGCRCVPCLEGVEFQQWRGGHLVLSHWWPKSPTQSDWAILVRAVGVQHQLTSECPAPLDLPWLRQPWLDMHGLESGHSPQPRLQVLSIGVAAVSLTTFSAGKASEAWNIYQQSQQVIAETSRAKLAAGPLLAARVQATQAAAAADQLAKSLQAVSSIDVLRHLSEVLPPAGVLLKEFDLQGQQLRLGLELGPEVQRSAVVRELQAGGWMTQVTEQREVPGRAWVSFDIRLATLRPPELPVRAATPAVASSAAKP